MSFKYYRTTPLIAIVALSGILLFLAQNSIGLQFSLLSAIGGVLFVIDRWLWNVRPFSYLFWAEDFSGRYEGELEYEYRDNECKIQKGKREHVKVIQQTGSRITIFSFTHTADGKPLSVSESKGLHVEKMKDDKHFQLTYSYLNDGNPELGFPPHYGTEVVKFIKSGKDQELTGSYFTNRLPYQTRGKFINLKKVSNNLNHDF